MAMASIAAIVGLPGRVQATFQNLVLNSMKFPHFSEDVLCDLHGFGESATQMARNDISLPSVND